MDRRTEELLHKLDRQSQHRTEAIRQMLRDEGRLDLLAEFDANMRDVRLGVSSARGTWHALSEPQRVTLRAVARGQWLGRSTGSKRYDVLGGAAAFKNICGLATARNLLARELLACDGGAFDPERKLILTERGAFVLRHGPQ